MSTCISPLGEFSDHILDDAYTCTRCLVLDEDALVDELRRVRRLHDDAVAKRDAAIENGTHWRTLWQEVRRELEAARPVVEAAVAYENRWRRYAGIQPGADSTEVRLAKGHAHQALLNAVRAAAVDLCDHPSTTEEKP